RCHQERERHFEGVVNFAILDAKREAFAHAREGGQDAIATRRHMDVKIADRLNEAAVERDLLLSLTQHGHSRTRINSLEADIRLFTTLVRFDEVYHGHFKCNSRRLVDYPNLWAFTRDIFQLPGVASTVNMEHIKRHYYESHRTINPTGIVPVGPR